MPALPSCDCINTCGDDPWIKQRKARPCLRLRNIMAREAQLERDLFAIRKALAAAYPREDMPLDAIARLVAYVDTCRGM